MENSKSHRKILFVCACIALLIGLAVIAIAEPLAFRKANAEYPMGQWAWYNEYRSFIYETVSANIRLIGIILSFLGTAGVVLIPLSGKRSNERESPVCPDHTQS